MFIISEQDKEIGLKLSKLREIGLECGLNIDCDDYNWNGNSIVFSINSDAYDGEVSLESWNKLSHILIDYMDNYGFFTYILLTYNYSLTLIIEKEDFEIGIY